MLICSTICDYDLFQLHDRWPRNGQPLAIPHLKEPSKDCTLFHLNDPRLEILAGLCTHSSDTLASESGNARKLAIVVVSLAAARRASHPVKVVEHKNDDPEDPRLKAARTPAEKKRRTETSSGSRRTVRGSTSNLKATERSMSQAESTGTKRKRIDDDTDDSEVRLKDMMQRATYGAEMLSHASTVNHAIHLLVIDDVAWVRWYDRQGAIRAESIDFIQDTPRFLVLLAAFQRSSLEDWGSNFALKPQEKYNHSNIKGRGDIWSALATGALRMDRLAVEGMTVRPTKPRILRVPAVSRLYPITALVGREFVKAWLECVQCAFLVRFSRTSFTRQDSPSVRSGNYALWERGVPHSSPSLDKLMVKRRMTADGRTTHSGVTSDWDLAHVEGHSQDNRRHRTGTLPFMALELLCDEYWDGKIERSYHHDLEALIWMLPWAFLRFEYGQEIKGAPLGKWKTTDYNDCDAYKRAFLRTCAYPGRYSPTVSYKDEWMLACSLLFWLSDQAWARDRAFRPPFSSDSDSDSDREEQRPCKPSDTYPVFWSKVEHTCVLQRLAYLRTLIPADMLHPVLNNDIQSEVIRGFSYAQSSQVIQVQSEAEYCQASSLCPPVAPAPPPHSVMRPVTPRGGGGDWDAVNRTYTATSTFDNSMGSSSEAASGGSGPVTLQNMVDNVIQWLEMTVGVGWTTYSYIFSPAASANEMKAKARGTRYCRTAYKPSSARRDIRNYLTTFTCGSRAGDGPGTATFPHFVRACQCDAALNDLRPLDIPHLKDLSKHHILFHLDDPGPGILADTHTDNTGSLASDSYSACKTAIVIASRAAAQRASHYPDTTYEDAWFEIVQTPATKKQRTGTSSGSRPVVQGSTSKATEQPMSRAERAGAKRKRIYDDTGDLEPQIIMLHCALSETSRTSAANPAIHLNSIVWWYDRQGAIQTERIDFIRDLPHLAAFQRFSPEDWGLDLALNPQGKYSHDGAKGRGDIWSTLTTATVRMNRLALEGTAVRSTKPRISRTPAVCQLSPITTLVGREFVEAWLECVRGPFLVHFTLTELHSPRLSFHTCSGHYALWERGAPPHSDPSLANLMVRRRTMADGRTTHSGVMSDWDLAHVEGHPQDNRRHRTGTLPFTALELCDEYRGGEIERSYRHGLEALIWMLPWVFLRFEDGQEIKGAPLGGWKTTDYCACSREKSYFLLFFADPARYSPTASYKDEWMLACYLLFWLNEQTQARIHAYRLSFFNSASASDSNREEQELCRPSDTYSVFWSKAQDACVGQHLGYLRALIPDTLTHPSSLK
ncbi:hypothetical protein EVG20_g8436 [Dentipellis fragilis]|uniref:Fungal-type protein kinase domain-containing protein n=1 Tax=Dentipellis fragilis TaxID=205917 RepID=A0A4Y9Y7E2_9AGAM|nr:hypothetical protein EVG20_g8436 [Dentipellis fragilis]